jgi:allantoin racemase
MNLLILNPNSTAPMTRIIQEAAEKVALPGTAITALSGSGSAIASFEGHADAAMAVPPMPEAIRWAEAAATPPDAFIIACFDDPGLLAAREVARAAGNCPSRDAGGHDNRHAVYHHHHPAAVDPGD